MGFDVLTRATTDDRVPDMNLVALAAWILAGVALSWAMTGLTRKAALRTSLLDHPNERSSHTHPTPRGGGLGIVLPFLGIAAFLHTDGQIDTRLFGATLGAGLLVAALGFVDDCMGLAARWRFAGHVAASAWIIGLLWPLPPLQVFGHLHEWEPWSVPVVALTIVWMINFFNFMDGIDGIAAIEATSVALGGALVWWLVAPGSDWLLAVLFAACVCGFLLWNFPPARIFMGDAGSGSLGVILAVLALWSARDAPHLAWSWLVLSGVFIVDATTTLMRRVRRGERFSEAHRNHAYQYAARKHGSHRSVTLAVLAINVAWLLPIAVAIALRWLDGMAGLGLALGPLVWLAYFYKAGDRAGQAI